MKELGEILANEVAPLDARMEKMEKMMAAEFAALEDK